MSRPEPREFVAHIGGMAVRVVHQANWVGGMDHFSFHSTAEPSKPHPLSQTGYLSHFADSVAVEHFGGPERFVAAFAEARLRGDNVMVADEPEDMEGEHLTRPEAPRQLSLF